MLLVQKTYTLRKHVKKRKLLVQKTYTLRKQCKNNVKQIMLLVQKTYALRQQRKKKHAAGTEIEVQDGLALLATDYVFV